ncbi:DUF2975 domain-containing protein [Photobacterium sanguinicancri]|uniref:DUF2975 domain-containing protein n=1 Tax=Photobacterium sanguinicancri TaxID=875932 RepID=A0AAW7XXJ8_9GAMM|nr:DUF2975 domain-containing protein [Photobacterium sanguinicancri]MDO6541028.1 DUF2975 domain-containing protein [Photobacterium sanguinicancri]
MSQQSISSFSRKLLILFWLSLIFVAVVNAAFWFVPTLLGDNFDCLTVTFPVEVILPLPVMRSLLGFIPSMFSAFLTVALLWQLIVLFRLYEQGTIFKRKNVDCYKKLSYLLIASPFVSVVGDVLVSLVLTLDNEGFNLSAETNDADITMMVIGFIVRVIAVVMERAVELHEESELTI